MPATTTTTEETTTMTTPTPTTMTYSTPQVAARAATAAGFPGFRYARQSPRTGALVIVIDGDDPGSLFDTDDGRWITVCDDHGSFESHATFTEAHDAGPISDDWCEACADRYALTPDQALAYDAALADARTLDQALAIAQAVTSDQPAGAIDPQPADRLRSHLFAAVVNALAADMPLDDVHAAWADVARWIFAVDLAEHEAEPEWLIAAADLIDGFPR